MSSRVRTPRGSERSRIAARVVALLALVAGWATATGPVVHADEMDGVPESRPGTSAAMRELYVDPSEAGRAVRVITAEEIWRSNARNLTDLLRQEFGLWMTFANYAGGSPVVRGLGGNDVLILLDGVKVNATAYRFGALEYLSMIDLFMLDRIEVVGGEAGRHGGDTLGPMIRLYSKRDASPWAPGAEAPDEVTARAYFRYSTVDKTSVARVEAHQEGPRYGFMFGLTSRDVGDLKGGGMVGFQRVTAYEEVAGNARFDYFLGDRRTLEVEAQIHEQQNASQYDRVEDGSHLAFELDPRKRTLFAATYLDDSDRSWSDSLRATLYLQQHRQRAFEQLTSEPDILTRTSDNDDVLGLVAEVRVDLGERHRLGYGLEFDQEDVTAVRREVDLLTGEEIERGKDPRRDGLSRERAALWVDDRISLGESFELEVGARWATYSMSGTFATSAGMPPLPVEEAPPAPIGPVDLDADDSGLAAWAGLVWRPSDRVHLFGRYDRGLRLPAIDEVTSHTSDESVVGLPNPDLTAATVDSIEVGGGFRSDRVAVDLALFRTEVKDVPRLRPVPTPGVGGPGVGGPGAGGISLVRSENFGEGEIDGFELSFDLALPLDLNLWGAWLAAEGDDPRNGAPLAGVPPAYGTLGLRWSGDFRWDPWVETIYRYTAEKDRLSPGESLDPRLDPRSLESYDLFTVRAGVTLPPRLRLVFTLENPADEAYLPYGSFLYAPGRNLALTAEYVF